MKTKRLILVSCLAAVVLIASPAMSVPQKRTVVRSSSTPTRMVPRTSQVTPTYRYGGTRHYGGTRYYFRGGFGYPYYGYYSYWPYSYDGYYPYSYYGDYYPYAYSYYSEPAYGYDTSLVAQVQHRLAELGYYYGVIDGIMGPQTRAAISTYESTHHLIVDGMINQQLLDRMGLG
jgi:hypothetical protein